MLFCDLERICAAFWDNECLVGDLMQIIVMLTALDTLGIGIKRVFSNGTNYTYLWHTVILYLLYLPLIMLLYGRQSSLYSIYSIISV